MNAEVAQFRDRTLSSLDYPNVLLDSTYVKARVNHRIESQATVVAIGVAADGRREELGSTTETPRTKASGPHFCGC